MLLSGYPLSKCPISSSCTPSKNTDEHEIDLNFGDKHETDLIFAEDSQFSSRIQQSISFTLILDKEQDIEL